MSVLITEPNSYSPRALQTYRRLGQIWFGRPPAGMDAQVSVLVVRLGHRIDANFIARYPALSAIASPTTGLTHIDLAICRQKGIRVYSLAECRNAIEQVTSTSELTLGLMIALLRRIPQAHHDVIASKKWDRDKFCSRQMSRLVLGIIGLGRIGGHVARYCRVMGMRVIACDPYQPSSRFTSLETEQRCLYDLLVESDIITIHADLRNDNINMISSSEVARMRCGTLLINTARGALVDESAIANAVRTGQLGGVAVDVLADEHQSKPWSDSPLVEAARDGLNVIVTPHIGGCTIDAMHITEECLADVVVNALEFTKT